MNMNDIVALIGPVLPVIQSILAVLIVGAVLLQTRGAQFSGAFSDTSNGGFYRRRGAELILFRGTIVLGILFAIAALLSLFVRG